MAALSKPCDNCNKPMNGGVYRAPHICPHCLHAHEDRMKKNRRSSRQIGAKLKNTQTEKPVAPPIAAQAQAASKPAKRTEPVFQTQLPVIDVEEASATPAQRQEPSIDIASTTTAQPSARLQPAKVSKSPARSGVAKPMHRDAVVLTTRSGEDQNIINVIDEIAVESIMSIELTADLFDEGGKFIGVKSEKVKAALAQGKKNALVDLRKKAKKLGGNLVTFVSVKNTVKAAQANSVNIIVRASGTCTVAVTDEEALELQP